MVQNFAIIAALILLYYFIPDSLRFRSKLGFSLCVGIVFGLTAAISIPMLWEDSGASVIGFNVILVPLSGVTGGPVSAVIVAIVLLAGSAASGGSLSSADVVTVMSGILLGAFFYAGQSWVRQPRSNRVRLLLLGMGVALIELVVFILSPGLQSPGGAPLDNSGIIAILPFILISCGGTVLLGSIIWFIDRKKQAERELLDHKEHLEGLVKERTAELRQANSLQKATFNATADGIVVVDREDRIRAYNQKALRMLNNPPQLQTGSADSRSFAEVATSLLVDPEGLSQKIAELPEPAEQVVTSDLKFKDGRICELVVQPERIGDRIIGRVFSIRDITEQRHAEDAIRVANNKLVLLSDITRHDIINQMTIISGYLELFRETVHDPVESERVEIMRKSLEVMRLQIEFTRDYQDLGIQKPVWENVQAAFTRASNPFAGRVSFTCDTGDLEIYTDPLIERVFYNLIDNSLRHGERITEIWLSSETADPDLILVYHDNGVGVPADQKEKIFKKGFGKHTGLGMFLIREILSITGMEIRENGDLR